MLATFSFPVTKGQVQRGHTSGRDQWQYERVLVGVWIERVSKILGEESTEEWSSSWTRRGGFSDLLGRLASVPTGLHTKMVMPVLATLSDTGTPSAMWLKAEDHRSQTTVFTTPPHPPSPFPRISDHFPRPCHLLSSSHHLFFPLSGLNNRSRLSPSIHRLHTCIILTQHWFSLFLCWQHVSARWKGMKGTDFLQHLPFLSFPLATAMMKSTLDLFCSFPTTVTGV